MPARGPMASDTQPTIGPPMGVEPRNTMPWMASTRPRYSAPASSWTMAVDVVMKAMEARPRSTATGKATPRLGEIASSTMATPKAAAAFTSCCGLTRERLAVARAPIREPTLSTENSRVKVPVPPESGPSTSSGTVTWKLKANVPIIAIITSGTSRLGSERM